MYSPWFLLQGNEIPHCEILSEIDRMSAIHSPTENDTPQAILYDGQGGYLLQYARYRPSPHHTIQTALSSTGLFSMKRFLITYDLRTTSPTFSLNLMDNMFVQDKSQGKRRLKMKNFGMQFNGAGGRSRGKLLAQGNLRKKMH
jgi:hypothetical protein